MANIKKMFLVMTSFIGLVGLQGSIVASKQFEILNNSGETISIKVYENGRLLKKGNASVSGKFVADINLNDNLTIEVATLIVEKGASYGEFKLYNSWITGSGARGKTKYLIFDPKESNGLYPQFSKRFSKMFSNNIKASDLVIE